MVYGDEDPEADSNQTDTPSGAAVAVKPKRRGAGKKKDASEVKAATQFTSPEFVPDRKY